MSNLVGATTAVFPVRLSVASNEIVNVEWTTSDGTALSGLDYKAAKGVVKFLPGETEKQIQALVYGQPIVPAADKVFYIRLSPPSNAILVDSLLTCKIVVDDLVDPPATSIIVAEGRRGPKGETGRSAYEQAVYMGLFTGTVEQWMQQIADASSAADRAENAAVVANSKVLAEELRAEAAERSLQSSIELKAPQLTTFTKTEVTGLVEPKADKTYVDTALSGFTNGASKFYATLAAANTDIANIGIKDKVDIGEVANGGTWYKAAAGATSLTKSPYDPVNTSKTYTDVKFKESTDYFDSKTGYAETSNIINPAQTTQNAYFNTTSTVSSPTWVFGEDYIPVTPGQKLWMKGVQGGNTFQFYKADKTPLWHGLSTTIVNGVFTVPLTVAGTGIPPAFMRIATNLSTVAFSNGSVQVGYGDVVPSVNLAYQGKFYYFKDDKFTKPILDKSALTAKEYDALNIKEFVNLVNPAQSTTQGFFGGTTISGTGNPTYADYYVGNDYYPAKVGDKFWMKGVTGGQVIQFCRADKTAIWNGLSQDIVNGIYTIPATVSAVSLAATAFIRIGTNLGSTAFSSGKVAMGKGDVSPKGIPVYNTYYSEPTSIFSAGIQASLGVAASALSGKQVLTIGDSIQNNPNTAIKVLCDRHGATLSKHTMDGAWVSHGNIAIPRILSESYTSISTAVQFDVIMVAAGTNDQIDGTNGALGVFTDRVTTTFYGALHVLLSGLRGMFPKSRIVYVSQIPRGGLRSNPATPTALDLKVRAVKEVCSYYSVPLWVGHENFGWNPDDNTTTKTDLMPDGLHPNIDGHIWYANRIEPFILNAAK